MFTVFRTQAMVTLCLRLFVEGSLENNEWMIMDVWRQWVKCVVILPITLISKISALVHEFGSHS